MELNGKVAIVTGASRGIGKRIALELARQGVRVAISARSLDSARSLPGTITETKTQIESEGGVALPVQADLAVEADIQRLAGTVLAAYGQIDILINNAAHTKASMEPLDSHPYPSWLEQYAMNIHAPFLLMQAVVPQMKAQCGGVIVNMTSIAAEIVPMTANFAADPSLNLGSMLAYGSSKAALNRLTNALAFDLRPHNIAIFCLDPGFTRTERVDVLQARGMLDAARAMPVDRPANVLVDVLTKGEAMARSGSVVRCDEIALP